MTKKKATTRKKKTVGINGFGRIGRAIVRIALEKKDFDVIVINDINPDNKNIAYQLKYDSVYGTLKDEIKPTKNGIRIGKKEIFVYHEKNIDEAPWKKHKISKVVDASGIHENLLRARNLKGVVDHVIVTNSPADEFVDRFVIIGVNDHEIDKKNDFIISNSICDANAFGPVAKILDREYGIEHGFITTIHPWLQYQNLLDGSSPSFAYPGSINAHYTFGRASTFSLLPKPTTAVSATVKALPSIDNKFYSFSFRVPTASVTSSDVSIHLKKKVTSEEVKKLFEKEAKKQKHKVFYNNEEPLVSIDFKGSEFSCIIDQWEGVIRS